MMPGDTILHKDIVYWDMKLSRQKFWLFLQAVVMVIVLCYQALWLTAKPAKGVVVAMYAYKGGKSIEVQYVIEGKTHTSMFMYDEDFSNFHTGRQLDMEYLPFARGSVRIKGLTAETIVWLGGYILFLIVSALVFIMPNYVIEKKSSFIISKRRPFIRYVVEERRKRTETISLIEKANLFAGYIEKFMFPFAISGFVALILYLVTWSVAVVIACFIAGTIWGVIRARRWRAQLKPDDPELDVLDEQPTWTDGFGPR
jgi:hypothetical protein